MRICTITDRSQATANGVLIAAAPEMVEALRGIVEQADAQRKAGDRYATIGTGMIEQLRGILNRVNGGAE